MSSSIIQSLQCVGNCEDVVAQCVSTLRMSFKTNVCAVFTLILDFIQYSALLFQVNPNLISPFSLLHVLIAVLNQKQCKRVQSTQL